MNYSSQQFHRQRAENTKFFKNICTIVVSFCMLRLSNLCVWDFIFFRVEMENAMYMDQYGVFSHFALNSNATISSVTSGVYKQLPPRAFKVT